VRGRRAVLSFPPNAAVIRQRDVRVKTVVRDGIHGVWVGFVTRAWYDAKVAVLRIDGVQPPAANLHPGNVVADRGDFPAFEMLRRNEHGEICLTAGAGEGRHHIMLPAFRRFDAEDQHMLRHPTLFARQVRTDAQCETFFAEQNVPAVTGADGDNGVILRKMADEPPGRIDI